MQIEVEERVVMRDQLNRGPEGGDPIDRVLHRWIVTTSTGYRAELTECPCALWRQIGVAYYPVPTDAPDWNTRPREIKSVTYVPMTNCLCGKASNTCTRGTVAQRKNFCHGWHRPRVDAMVAALHRTVSTKGRADMRAILRRPVGTPRRLDLAGVPSYEQLAELKAFETLVVT